MKKKKLISIVTALVLFGSLTACGNSQGTSQSGQENQTSQTGSGAPTESSNQTQSDGQTANTKEKNLYGYDEPVTIKVGLSFAADFKWVGDDTSTDNVWMDLYRENNIMPEIL